MPITTNEAVAYQHAWGIRCAEGLADTLPVSKNTRLVALMYVAHREKEATGRRSHSPRRNRDAEAASSTAHDERLSRAGIEHGSETYKNGIKLGKGAVDLAFEFAASQVAEQGSAAELPPIPLTVPVLQESLAAMTIPMES